MEKLPRVSLFHSVTTRIVVLTLTVLVTVGVAATLGLTRREHVQLIATKTVAVTMTTELFAATVAAALDLGDEHDIAERMEPLRSNQALVYAAVWRRGQNGPAAELGQRPADAPALEVSGVSRDGAYLTVLRPVPGPAGEAIGTVGVQVTLAPENHEFHASRWRIAAGALATAALTFALLVMVLQLGVVARLRKVAQAAARIETGQYVRVPLYGRDELGQLSRAFNAMADAIGERETRLANALRRLQTLLDHMGQAIVTFDADGRVLGDRSRQAEQLFGPALTEGASIVSLLYPVGREQLIEADAFRSWIDAAFENDGANWQEVLELAPPSVTVARDSGQITDLDLEFRWVPRQASPPCIMLIATDSTQRRRLERTMEQTEREHKKTIAALRWLVSGGGQLFVRFLEQARGRIGAAIRSTRTNVPLDAVTTDQVFRDVHTVRAEARCFDLKSVDSALTQVEVQLADLRGGRIVAPLEIEKMQTILAEWLVTALGALDKAERQFIESSPIGREVLDQMTVRRSDVDRLLRLTAGRHDEVAQLARAMTARPFGETVVTVVDAAPRWAEHVGKRVQMEVSGAENRVPGRLAELLPGVLSHLVRNAIAHGIELGSTRSETDKPSVGRIRLICEASESAPVIRIEDDGRGIDLLRLGVRDVAEAAKIVLEPGVTTQASATGTAGFGIGLSAVRHSLAQVDYDVELHSEVGRGAAVIIRPRAVASQRGSSR